MTERPRAADDFEEIRKRLQELERERQSQTPENAEPETPSYDYCSSFKHNPYHLGVPSRVKSIYELWYLLPWPEDHLVWGDKVKIT